MVALADPSLGWAHRSFCRFCHVVAQVISFLSENKAVGIMKPGHCFTIEPMINEGKISMKSLLGNYAIYTNKCF